jgi:hypothetical protein
MADDVTIQVDTKHRALRSGMRWAITRLQPDGSYDLIAHWDGGRRSLLNWCRENNVYPSRAAEAALDKLPESVGFRDRS